MEDPGWFVGTAWLRERLGDAGMRVVQVGGESHYARMHVPGALLLPYAELTVMRDGVPGMRPDQAHLSALFGRLGIGPETAVLAYDVSGGTDAARLIWTLASMGHRGGLAILDGGLSVWVHEGHPTEAELPRIGSVGFTPRPDARWEADRERVLAVAEGREAGVLLDTRSRNEYVGMTLRMPRGHIPGALHLDWMDLLVGRHDPRLQDAAAMRARLAAIGLDDPGSEVILYCESAHRASHTWTVLRHLGWEKVRLYDGSMAEWRMSDGPVVLGETPR
ncbi:MAG: sulfurtransferase [Magnetococcales bacterium]|nr:sulfurtransferase [Magnetococcales bacterium]